MSRRVLVDIVLINQAVLRFSTEDINVQPAIPSGSPSRSPSQTPSPSPSPSRSPSLSVSPSKSRSASPSKSPSPTPPVSSVSLSPSLSKSASPSSSIKASPSMSPSISPSASVSPSMSLSLSPSISQSASPSVTASPSQSPSPSASVSPSASKSSSPSISLSASPSSSVSPSASPSVTSSPSASRSPSHSRSASPSRSKSPSPSKSPSHSRSASPSITASASPSWSPSASVSRSPSASKSPSPSATPSPIAGQPLQYKGRLLETPQITKTSPDDYWGIEEMSDVTVRLDNADGYFSQSVLTEDYRGKVVRFWSYDEERPEDYRLLFEQAGKATFYSIGMVFELTVSSMLKDKLQVDYPKRTYQVSDWPEVRPDIFNPTYHLGTPYNFCFGRCYHVPITYVHCDYDYNLYDYILCYGPIKSAPNIYREQLIVPTYEYFFFDGTQDQPYPGFAFIRFFVEQRIPGTTSLYTLTADINGFTFGSTSESRNFVVNVREFLSNTVWGLNELVDWRSFEEAEDQIITWGDYYMDGHVSDQRAARDILNDMLMACRAKLKMNEDGAWQIALDVQPSTVKAYLGSGDGYWENITEITNYSTTSTDNALKKIIVKYRYDEWKSEYEYQYSRLNFDFGEETEIELPFVRSHTTADIIVCYLRKRAYYRDKSLEVKAMDLVQNLYDVDDMDLVNLDIPLLLVDSDYRVRSVSKDANEIVLDLVSHNSDIYVYTAADPLNIDPVIHLPDWTTDDSDNPNVEKPLPPISIGGIEWTFRIGPGGLVYAKLYGKAERNPLDNNFHHIEVGYRDYDETDTVPYTWIPGFKYGTENDKWIGPFGSNEEWRVYLEFVASTFPGPSAGDWQGGGGGAYRYFDAAVKSVNINGVESEWVMFPHEQIPYKPEAPPDLLDYSGIGPVLQTVIGNSFTWVWQPVGIQDDDGYHFQISSSGDFTSTIVDSYITGTSVSYTTTEASGSTLYFRVRSKNTTLIEAWNWSEASGVVGEEGGGSGSGGTLILPVFDVVHNIGAEYIPTVGDWVNIYAPHTQFTCIRKAHCNEIGWEAHGFVIEDGEMGELMTVYLPGNTNNYAKNTECGSYVPGIGGYVYLSTTPGHYSYSPPEGAGKFVQKLGLPIIAQG